MTYLSSCTWHKPYEDIRLDLCHTTLVRYRYQLKTPQSLSSHVQWTYVTTFVRAQQQLLHLWAAKSAGMAVSGVRRTLSVYMHRSMITKDSKSTSGMAIASLL